jgi:hypothetical protein
MSWLSRKRSWLTNIDRKTLRADALRFIIVRALNSRNVRFITLGDYGSSSSPFGRAPP